ncbi:L,D-transpeptidase, partial [Vibrio sp. FNV 38]|nr:L,D-transpeptidase [Vibrio sp. FNV 38]
AYLSEEKIREYVMNIGIRYNTIYYNRTFTTTGGAQVEFSEHENNYGFLVDEEGEYAQLVADIQANTAVEREPVYAYRGVRHSGRDDLVGTYVEVSLGAQHLWFYKDYSLIVETDIVSGCIAKNTPTQRGVFP